MKTGNCVICGKLEKLTRDHVPPKSVMSSSMVEVSKFVDALDLRIVTPRTTKYRSTKGFYTLCAECNNRRLGSELDPALTEFVNSFRRWIQLAYWYNVSLPEKAVIRFKPAKVAKAVIGHMLAAEVRQNRKQLLHGEMIDAMRSYFLGNSPIIPEKLLIFVWPYPEKTSLVGRSIGFYSLRNPKTYVMDLLKFFPVAFGVVYNDDLSGLPALTSTAVLEKNWA